MNLKLAIGLTCSAALLTAFNAQAAEKSFSIGGDIELDLNAGHSSSNKDKLDTSGRVKFDATSKLESDNGYFVKGVGQFALPINGDNVGFEDVYVQFGRSAWNLQFGRFEGLGVFNKGKDTLVAHAGGLGTYEGNYARGRYGDGNIHAALNVGSKTKFQLGLVAGKENDDSLTGIRPAVSFSAGSASMSAAVETLKDDKNDTKKKGFGLTGSLGLGGGTVGASFAKGTTEVGTAETDTTSAALYYTKNSWGVGYIHSTVDDGMTADDPSVNTLHAAYTMPLFGLKDASMTVAASTSKAKNVTTDDTVNAAKLRFNYSF